MRLLTYNIQSAIAADSYLSYFTRLHRQVLPAAAKDRVLADIARYIAAFDVVCLQEIDCGGRRNAFRHHAEQLLAATPFAYCLHQTNRVVGKLSRHGNLILSKTPLEEVLNAPLPARIRGRGVLAAKTGLPESGEIVIANIHLSLGAADQTAQLRYIAGALAEYENVCLAGDFNCLPDAPPLRELARLGYRRLGAPAPTYPSWRPKRALDHVFVKGRLHGGAAAECFAASDHLPLAAEIRAA